MVAVPSSDAWGLQALGDVVRLDVVDRSYLVHDALDVDRIFKRQNRSRSSLERDLLLDSLAQAASQAGLFFTEGGGGVAEVHHQLSDFQRRAYRVRRMRRGTRRIPVNNVSAWATLDEDTLERLDLWVLAFDFTADGKSLEQFFVAPVLDVVEGKPGYLTLGDATALGKPASPDGYDYPGSGFTPTDESLDDFFEDGLDVDANGA